MAASGGDGGTVLEGSDDSLDAYSKAWDADEAEKKAAFAAKWTKRLEAFSVDGVNWLPDRCYRSLMGAWIEDYMLDNEVLPQREKVTAEVLSIMYRFGDEDERDFVVLAYASPAWEK